MSYVDGDKFIVEREAPRKCELCGAMAELRPYGPNRENICAGCGHKNPEMTRRRMAERIQPASLVVDNSGGGFKRN